MCIVFSLVILVNYWTWEGHENLWIYSQLVRSARWPGNLKAMADFRSEGSLVGSMPFTCAVCPSLGSCCQKALLWTREKWLNYGWGHCVGDAVWPGCWGLHSKVWKGFLCTLNSHTDCSLRKIITFGQKGAWGLKKRDVKRKGRTEIIPTMVPGAAYCYHCRTQYHDQHVNILRLTKSHFSKKIII